VTGSKNEVNGHSNIVKGDQNSIAKIKTQDLENIKNMIANLGKSLYLSKATKS